VKVQQMMRQHTVFVPQKASLSQVIDRFVEHHIDTLPVVDEEGLLKGIITVESLSDICLPHYYEFLRDYMALEDKGQLVAAFDQPFKALDEQEDRLILAADLMRSHLRWILEEQSVLQAASLLHAQRCERLPVVNRSGQLVGLLSKNDILLALLGRSQAIALPIHEH